MRYNTECLRQIMLLLEDKLDIAMTLEQKFVDYNELTREMKDFSTPEIIHHLNVLSDSGLIIAKPQFGDGKYVEYLIFDITSKGYEFLDIVRDNSAWKKFLKFVDEHKGVALNFVLEHIAAL